jgi:hypothetical protein
MCYLQGIRHACIGSDYARHQSSTPEATGGFLVIRL